MSTPSARASAPTEAAPSEAAKTNEDGDDICATRRRWLTFPSQTRLVPAAMRATTAVEGKASETPTMIA
jgi:hypothetical protein